MYQVPRLTNQNGKWGRWWVAASSLVGMGDCGSGYILMTAVQAHCEEWLLQLPSFTSPFHKCQNTRGSQSPGVKRPYVFDPALTPGLPPPTLSPCKDWHRALICRVTSEPTLTEERESAGLGTWGIFEFALKTY